MDLLYYYQQLIEIEINIYLQNVCKLWSSFSMTEIRKWRSLSRDEAPWLLETFTFLKYKYEENFILNVEVGEFSICGYVGDNVQCWKVCFNTNFNVKFLKCWSSRQSFYYFLVPFLHESFKVHFFYASCLLRSILDLFLQKFEPFMWLFKRFPLILFYSFFMTTNEKNGWHLIRRSVVCFFFSWELIVLLVLVKFAKLLHTNDLG